MTQAQKDEVATHTNTSPELEMHVEDHSTADTYQSCCIMCKEASIALSRANLVTVAGPVPLPRREAQGTLLVHGMLNQK